MGDPAYRRPALPSGVARQLRQESGFGCAKCGHPYLEYHHIVTWAEEQHFRPEDMMPLCGNCHPAVAKFSEERQRDIKASPFNKTKGSFAGALEFDKRDLIFKVGGCWYENTPVILQYRNTPIISCRLDEGQALVSLNLFSQAGARLLTVVDNEIDFRLDAFWDFEYGHNWAIARSGPRQIALKLDFSGAEAAVEGRIWLGPELAILARDYTSVGGNGLVGCTFKNAPVAVCVD